MSSSADRAPKSGLEFGVGEASVSDPSVIGRLSAERANGPRVVAFGGGTGMSALLRGLKEYTDRITAVVTVTDNGGSSGRLRNNFDIAAPGDIRNCLLALADIDPLVARTLQYRFEETEFKDHCFGNLFITVLTRLVGDLGTSVRELNRLLNVRGRVLPATSTRVSLVAQHPDGTKSTGEVQITRSGKAIQRVEIRPQPIPMSPEVRQAVEEADLFLFGPGSLYTSVLPNLLLDGLVDAIQETGKSRVYICNIMTQPGETDGFSLSDHLAALRAHVGDDFPDAVVAHQGEIPAAIRDKYLERGAEPVECDLDERGEFSGVRLITGDFFSTVEETADESPVEGDSDDAPDPPATARHDPAGLARVIYHEFLQSIGNGGESSSVEESGAKKDQKHQKDTKIESDGTRALG